MEIIIQLETEYDAKYLVGHLVAEYDIGLPVSKVPESDPGT